MDVRDVDNKREIPQYIYLYIYIFIVHNISIGILLEHHSITINIKNVNE